MGKKRKVYTLLVGKLEGKRTLGRPRLRLIDNVKMDLSEIDLCGLDWIGVTQDMHSWRAVVNAVMNILAQEYYYII
jgi:hypothetical protein